MSKFVLMALVPAGGSPLILLSSGHVCIALVERQACANHWGAWRKAQVKRQSHAVNKQTAWEDMTLLFTILVVRLYVLEAYTSALSLKRC